MELLSYFYHSDHTPTWLSTGLGSSSWITNNNGEAIQHLHYLPYGEDWINQRTSATSWNAPYTFSAKEKDVETGYGYFGARYYDSGLSIWLSVDPMSDKYPSMSPYNYCANNPVILVDPDGRKVIPVDKESKGYMKSYFKEIFGTDKMFRFSGGELKIRDKQFEKYYANATPKQKFLLDGFKEAIETDKSVKVKIGENINAFEFTESIPNSIYEKYTVLELGSCSGVTGQSNLSYDQILINDKRGNKETYSSGSIDYGFGNIPLKTNGRASDVFVHELLDEFLNINVKGQSPYVLNPLNSVQYQNAALQNCGKQKRDGLDH
jgi:RHS repeat-associated protein